MMRVVQSDVGLTNTSEYTYHIHGNRTFHFQQTPIKMCLELTAPLHDPVGLEKPQTHSSYTDQSLWAVVLKRETCNFFFNQACTVYTRKEEL